MKRNPTLVGAVLGALTAIPVMAILYLAEQFAQLPFTPFDTFDWLARVLPGNVITLAIDGIVRVIQGAQLGDTSSSAKMIEQIMAIGLFIGIGAVLGIAVALLRGRFSMTTRQLGIAVAAVAFFPLYFISLSTGLNADPMLAFAYLLLVYLLWGATLGWATDALLTPVTEAPADPARRNVLGRLVGGSVALSLLGFFGGRLLASNAASSGAGQALPGSGGESATGELPMIGEGATTVVEVPSADELAARFAPAGGTRDELTSNDDFYRIDINTRPIVIQESDWQLGVSGLFENARNFTLTELMAYPAVTQPVTMGCISNRVGGDLISTSNWTGVALGTLLTELGIRPDATALLIEGADGFYETVSREDFEDPRTLLIYGMNGETLPVEHGFPLRIYIPNRYGMKQPKWITRMEAVAETEPGYWVVRGWSQEARPQIVSVIDTVDTGAAADGIVPVGGIAWAGARGIVKVEVQADEGEWQEAELRLPTLSPLTWVQWRYDWAATPGSHTLRVRATDGTNTAQTQSEQGVRPDGATGYHSRTVTV